MPLTDLIAPAAVIPALKVNGKKQALQELSARMAALTGESERAILEILLQREKLGSTGVGGGIAIPHGKLLQAVWGPDYGNEIEYLHVFVNQIRKKIEPDPAHPRHLLTELRIGYRFSLNP